MNNLSFVLKEWYINIVSKLIKILSIWLLVFAIPLQGYAAATMINCADTKDHQHQTQANTENNAVGSEHNHASHQHEATKQTSDVANKATDKSPSSKHACSHCLKCTSCCSASTIFASSLNLFFDLEAEAKGLSITPSFFIGFIPAGLERPPRNFLV